ncbi:MAG: hypothetical protein ACFE9C_14460 [Candidatus Hodarchaeota archaeon]
MKANASHCILLIEEFICHGRRYSSVCLEICKFFPIGTNSSIHGNLFSQIMVADKKETSERQI